MKKLMSVILALVMMLTVMSINVFAAEPTSGTCGENFTWTFNTETGEFSIDGTGEMYDYSDYNRPWESYVYEIKTVTIGNSVTKIGSNAFYDCNITSVTIPDSVTTIGDCVFFRCTGLTNVTIGNSVTTIGDGAFSCCFSLTSVTIGNSVTTIGFEAFWMCYGLTDVYCNGTEEDWNEIDIGDYNGFLINATIHYYDSGICGEDLTWYLNLETGELSIEGTGKMTNYDASNPAPWDEYKDQIKKIVVSDGVTTIGNDAFVGCGNLEEVTLPEGLTKIGDSAFRDCANLDEIEFPATVKTLGHYAFYGCTGLTDVNIGDGVTTIGNYAFRNCSNLKTVTLPATLTKIGKGAFMGCDSLSNAEYMGTDEQWEAVTIGENNDPLIEAMKDIVLGDVNCDGKINSFDALICLEYSVEKAELTADQFKAADVTGDGKVSSMDALQILNYSVGKIDKF